MYRQLGKMDACQADYTAARPAQLHRTWFAYQPNPSLLGGNHDSDSGSALVGWLPMFYDQVRRLEHYSPVFCHFPFLLLFTRVSHTPPSSPPLPPTSRLLLLTPPCILFLRHQVLSVLQEERRRASEVFGANDGSMVVVGVGTAVFEPIVASFAQRLAEGTFSFR